MGTPGSDCESVLSETKLDVSYVRGKARICKVIQEKIKATRMRLPRFQVVGLYGRGGIGKTTFCKAMCNEMWTDFNGKVFHFELEGENMLKTYQTLLAGLTGTRNEDVRILDRNECGRELGKELRKHRVFLAIDNVTDSTKVIAQADALLANCFGKGSVVLVTARSYDQLAKLKANIREIHCIEMPELEENEATSLLLHHAAPAHHVNEDVLRQCLQRCCFRKADEDGTHFLPLALEMLGQQLGDDPDRWMARLDELDHTSNQSREPEHPIFSILRKSFDSLSKEDQILFMDAALFYPRNYHGHHRDQFRVWNISTLDWLHMIHGGSTVEDIKRRLKGLKEKSLLQNFDESSTGIGVHDLWREFAAEEANTVGKLQGSSVWFYDNDEDGAQHRGEASLSGGGWENLHRASIWRRGKLKDKLNFSLCSNLTVLTLRNVPSANQQLNLTPLKCLKHLEVNGPVREVLGLGSLAHLVVLRWFRMPAISSCLQEIGLLKNLQVLQLQFLPWKRKDSSRVKFHQMDFSRLSLLRVFSLSAPGDEWWPFSSYSRDVRFLGREIQHEIYGRYAPRFDGGVHMTGRLGNFHNLQSLQELDISRCVCIRALPGLDELVGLLELKASGCGSLEELPSLEKLQRLQRLDVSYCFAIRALPGLDELVGLVALDACGCCNLEELPSLQKLQHLQRLDISVCSTIKAVPGLGDLVSLLALRAGGCRSLEELPSLQKLQKLQRLDISGCHLITALPGFGDLVALQELRAQDCFNLAELPDLRQLTSLRVLNLKKASYYQEYQMKRPEETYIEGEPAVITAVPGLDELLALSKLTVDFRVFEDSAPHDLRKLRILTRVTLSGWSSEAALGVASLPNLQVLRISYGGGVEPTGVSSLRSLTRLKLYRCDFEDASCLSSSPALQHLHVKSHRSNQKKLLVSLIDIPSLRFTVHVDHGEDRDWYPIRHEIEALRARSQHLSSSSNSSPCQN